MYRRTLTVLFLLLAALLMSHARAGKAAPETALELTAFRHPGGMHTRAQIQAVRDRLDQEPFQTAFHELLQEAEQQMNRRPAAMPDYNVPEYYQNPEGQMAAKQGLSLDAQTAYMLALAYQLETGEQRLAYARKSAEFLNAWASANHTVSGGDGHLTMCYAGIPLIFAADLLGDFHEWSPESRAQFKSWVRNVFLVSARDRQSMPNNQGAWGNFAVIAACHLLDDRECVDASIERLRWRIENTMAPDGELPHENKRTNSGMWYTYFALSPMTGIANIAKNATGEDLFQYVSPSGLSLKLALDKLFEYSLAPETWPYKRPDGPAGEIYNALYPSEDEVKLPAPDAWPGNLFEAMAAVYGEQAWSDWVAPHRPIGSGRGWLYTTLMPPAFMDEN